MMISPESFIEDLKDKSYEELVSEKDKLIKKIHEFEKPKGDVIVETLTHPSPKVVYQCNLEYLSKLLLLIKERFNEQENSKIN